MTARLLATICTLTFAVHASAGTAPTSFIPKRDLATFLSQTLDLASFRNSLGQLRTPEQRTLAALGIKPTTVRGNSNVFETEDWTYTMKLLQRADINRDGLEDLEVCFTDKAKQGSYHAQQALLLTRYSASGPTIAVKYEVDGCPEYAK